MRGLERAAQWLRPIVETKSWDYCVVWKLGDDPSRFIEWMGCCCSGGVYIKVEREEQQLGPLCRDEDRQHPIRTKACEALARYPRFISLYSGIHGDVVISKQPRWVSLGSASDSNPSYETMGTQVLIPVFGGLIELFAAKNTRKDPKFIDFIASYCNMSLEQDILTAQSYANVGLNEQGLHQLLEGKSKNSPTTLHCSTSIPRIQVLTPTSQSNTHRSFEGSSSGSNPPDEHRSFDSDPGHGSPNGPSKPLEAKSLGSKRPRNLLRQQTGLVFDCGHKVAKDNAKAIQRLGRDCKSKNLVTERNRRNRIKDGLFALRALVPKISKMDRAAILGDAIDYIGELQKEITLLRDELKEFEDEGHEVSKAEEKLTKPDEVHEGTKAANDHIQNCSGFIKKEKPEVDVEVNQISKRDFLIKLVCEQKRGGFGRLMEAINSLGLEVADANITTLSGKVLNILKVKANKEDIQPAKLRDLLSKVTSCTNETTGVKFYRE